MNDRKELENYEAKEAKELVRLLKKQKQPQAEGAPPSFKAKVLARLEEQRGKRQRHSWTFGFRVPLALAAGLVLGFGLGVFFPENTIFKPFLEETTHFRGANSESASTDKYQSPEEWLESIAELLVTGQVKEAHKQITAFRQQYPTYEQNSATP